MELVEKAAQLRDYAEELRLDPESVEGKLFAALLDLTEDLAVEVEALRDRQDSMYEGLEAVSDDLAEVEDALFGDDEDDDLLVEADDTEEEGLYAVNCPLCGETVYFDDSALEAGSVLCPNCDTKIRILPGDAEDEEEEEPEM